jgi:hypothetical protein
MHPSHPHPPQPSQNKPHPLTWSASSTLNLKAVKPYNHNTSHFDFELSGKSSGVVLYPVMSLIDVVMSDGTLGALVDKKGKLVMHMHTPISRPEDEGEIVLLIK